MTTTILTPQRNFQLEGFVLGLIAKKPGKKPKYLHLATQTGTTYMIKLSKSLRQVLLPHLTAELWVVVKGVQKENTTAIQYKATAMTLMPPKSASDSRDGSRATSSPCATETRSTPKRSKPSSILVCRKSACMKRGGKTVCEMLEQTLRDRGLESQVQIKTTGCMKQCKAGPNLTFMPDKKHYTQVKHKEIPGLIDRHFATLKRSAG